MSALLGHCGLLLAPAAALDPYWAQVASLISFENGYVDQKDGTLWTSNLGSPAIESSIGFAGEPALRLHEASNDRIGRALAVGANEPMTLEAWCYFFTSGAGPGYFNGIFWLYNDASNSIGVSIDPTPDGFGDARLAINNHPNQAYIASTVRMLTRVHVAMTKTADGLWTYYKDGVADAGTQTQTIAMTKLYIGYPITAQIESSNFEMKAFRATRAVRYTGNFTPPVLPWPPA